MVVRRWGGSCLAIIGWVPILLRRLHPVHLVHLIRVLRLHVGVGHHGLLVVHHLLLLHVFRLALHFIAQHHLVVPHLLMHVHLWTGVVHVLVLLGVGVIHRLLVHVHGMASVGVLVVMHLHEVWARGMAVLDIVSIGSRLAHHWVLVLVFTVVILDAHGVLVLVLV